MIVGAFAEYLKEFDDDMPTNVLLFGWLKARLSQKPECLITKVIHEEISLISDDECNITFAGKSKTGIQLLESLYNFADSYEQQKFTRWVHSLKASDFRSFIK